jgi:NAD-dependent dihydropyrimidine dehydrogenase PreA subunit
MKYIDFNNFPLSQLVLKYYKPNTEILSYAYSKGIKTFDVYKKTPNTIESIGEWLKETKYEDVAISVHDKCTDYSTIQATVSFYKDILIKIPIIFNISHTTEYTTELEKQFQDLNLLQHNKTILGYGVRTHISTIASKVLLKNIKSLQLPVNAVENALFLNLKNLITETGVTLFAFNILGDGNRFVKQHPEDLLIYSVMSLAKDSIMIMDMPTESDVDRIVDIIENYNGAIYPIIEDFCTKCQKCEDVCMNKYPLAKYVKYCKNIETPETKEWGEKKLLDEQIIFECINCSLCESICPLNLSVKHYVKTHLEMLS